MCIRMYVFTCLHFYFSQMRRLPFFDDGFKGRFDFARSGIEWIPAQLRADSLLFEFSTSPDKCRANNGSDDAKPVILNEKRCNHDENANSHHVRPPEIAKISFAVNDEGKAESDDEEGDNADEDAEVIHSYQ